MRTVIRPSSGTKPSSWMLNPLPSAFGHTDPMLGAEAGAKYDALFTRIVNLAPPPIGLGPERQPA